MAAEISRIGETVESHLEATLDRLQRGELALNDLTDSLAGFYHCGWADGRASCEPTIVQLEADRTRLYNRAFPEDEWIIRERIGQAVHDEFFERGTV